ncbi:MAG: hypothetical protein Q8M15_11110 [Bacteroidota bacterium]|nr:hypothetical protein [Bacteroidota bacterium]
MKTLLVNIMDESQEATVIEMLNNFKDVNVEKLENSVYPDLTEDQISILNDRIEDYQRNPQNTISLAEFKNHIKEKYGI